jgi:hypothetical protein
LANGNSYRAFSDWEKSVQREALLRGPGHRGSSLQGHTQHRAFSDWEKSVQREALLRGPGHRGSSLQDSLVNKIEKEIGGKWYLCTK